MLKFLNSQPLLLTLLIVVVGYFIGQIKINGFSLDSSAVLFVALLCGHWGLNCPEIFKTIGVTLFIYSIGLQAGPRFLTIFKKRGIRLFLLGMIMVGGSAVTTLILSSFLSVDPGLAAGIFSGALTSTPGLAAASEASGSPLASIGYGLAYPFGVMGVIFFLKVFKTRFHGEISDVESEETAAVKRGNPDTEYIQILITRPEIHGKKIREIEFGGCVVTRLIQKGDECVPRGNSRLFLGDMIRVVGRQENLQKTAEYLGFLLDADIPQKKLSAAEYVVSNKHLLGKSLRELNMRNKYGVNIASVKRSGMNIPVSGRTSLEWGDRVLAVGRSADLGYLRNLMGDDDKVVQTGEPLAVFLGVSLGILVGLVPFSLGHALSFRIGIPGGVLLSGLVLGNLRRTGPVIWRPPDNIVSFFRETGLVLFLAAVGSSAGAHLMEVVSGSGVLLLAAGALLTVIPMFTAVFLGIRVFRLNAVELLGMIPGGMTSSPGFAVASEMTDSATPALVYAAVYPVSMVCMIVCCQILVALI